MKLGSTHSSRALDETQRSSSFKLMKMLFRPQKGVKFGDVYASSSQAHIRFSVCLLTCATSIIFVFRSTTETILSC